METRVSNSRFIATLAPAFTVEEARAFIQRIRAEFSDATHNVPAFVIGYGDSVTTHCSDAGEPSGTCLLYTSDAADDLLCVDIGGRRSIQTQLNL